MNMETIDDPLKAALKVKYFLIGALSIAVFRHIIKSFITSKLIKGLVLSLVISIGTTTLYGLYVLCTHDNFLNLNEPGASGRNWGFTDYMRHAHSCLYITILMIAWLVHGTTIKISIKTMCIVAIVFGVIGIITSGTRGAIGAFLISFPLIWGHRKWMWKIAGGAIIASAAFFAFNLNYTTDKGVFRPVAPDRANMWYLAIKAFEEKPILGHGVRQFEVQASRLEATHGHWLKQPTGKIRGIAHAHNIGMQLLADVGLAGTVTWGLWYILSIS